MTRHMHHDLRAWHDAADLDARRQTESLAALAVTLLIVVVGLYLVDVLRTKAAFQDCVLSGQTACEMASR